MKSRSFRTYSSLSALAGIFLFIFLLFPSDAWGSNSSNAAMARIYWRLAALDGYSFSSTVQQTTHPLPTVANIGLSSQQASLLVTGSVDKPSDLRTFTISEQSGYLLDGAGEVEMKVQDGESWRRLRGREWEKLEQASAPDAGSSDPVAFLQATRNVQLLGDEERAGNLYQVYSYELDGYTWANVMRGQIQEELTRRGELAPGQIIDSLEYYEKMTGEGEVWVNAAGVPQRITLHALYPPLPGEKEYREVKIVTDYSGWQGLEGKSIAHRWQNFTGSLSRSLPDDASEATGALTIFLFLFAFICLPLAFVYYRRSPKLYRATMLLMAGLMVIQPLLNASVVQAASDRRQLRAAGLQQERAQNDKVQQAIDQVNSEFSSNFDPTRSVQDQSREQAAPINAASLSEMATFNASLASDPDSDGDRLTDKQEASLKTDPNKKDSDGDGIDDGTEYNTLGLNPIDPDTDGDLLSDGFETAGMMIGNRMWYLDPQNRDTNGDNIADTLECVQGIDVTVSNDGKATKVPPKGTGICEDSDGDGTPDFADDDNDNDGVWDWLDGQPQGRFGDLAEGVKDRAFAYSVDNYSTGKALRLTFEVRPTDSQHLWYSMNVLDWPSEDYSGQIQRVHNTTIGSSGLQANGDMQLVPMLEVTMPADEASHLPTIAGKQPIVGDNGRLAEWLDMPALERYQMAVSWTQDQKSLRIYLPATLIRDTRGGAPLNFVAKMLYMPNGSGLFSTNHTARLVWLVQLDTDSCTPPTDSNYSDSCLPEGKNYQNGKFWTTSKQQIVHRYYDSFYLNAFTAEEEQGVSTQIFYEDPNLVTNKAAYVPDQLLGLGNVMELYIRQNISPTAALQAWKTKNPKMASRLVAAPLEQANETYSLLAKISTQTTPNLLDSLFKPYKDQLTYPTLLFVTWGKSKVNGLSGISTGDTLKINMSEATSKSATGVRLGSFSYNANPSSIGGVTNPNWDAAEPSKVWAGALKNQSIQVWQGLPVATQQKIDVESFQQAALSMYWNLVRGAEISTDFESAHKEKSEQANGMVDEFSAAFDNGGNNGVAAMLDTLADFKEAKANAQSLSNAAEQASELSKAKFAKGIATTAVTLAGLSATLSIVLALKDQIGLSEGTVTALEGINASLGAALAIVQTVQEVNKATQAIQSAGGFFKSIKDAFAAVGEVSKAAVVVAIVVIAVIIVASLIIFFKFRGDGNPVAAKTALAQGVATALVVAILFIIGILLFPIGAALALIAGLIDALITAYCKIRNWIGGKDADGKSFEDRNSGFCAGIVGNAVKAIATFLYITKPMVDMTYKDRLQFGRTDTKLVEQNGLVGMSADNRLEVKQPLTVTLRIPDDHSYLLAGTEVITTSPGVTTTVIVSNRIGIDNSSSAIMPLSEYERLIKEKSVFNYELVPNADTDQNSELENRTTPGDWQRNPDTTSRDRLSKDVTATLQITLAAGINWKPELQVREYFKFPLAECGLFAGGCDYKFSHFTKDEKGSKEMLDLGKNLIYDVFPATLTEFRALEQVRENGQFVNRYRLNWGGSDKPFPTLVDADSDGLRSDGTGTLDPDDKTGDKDGDGLPDPFEVQDYRLNPSEADSDMDGLNDYQEIRYGTRPDRADSDGDGLNDGDEINGWEFVYVDADNVTKRTWVTANPNLFDTDGDGFSDQQERVLAFHPRARTLDPKILSLVTTTGQHTSTWLAPQQSLAFTSTVKNELSKPIAYGLLEAQILNSNSTINPITFELQPQQSSNIQGTINVPATPPNSNSTEITLRNRAGANIVDPSASYASLLQGLASNDGLKFLLNFEQRQPNTRNFMDATGKVTLTCPDDQYCPQLIYGTDSFGRFRAQNWYLASGSELAFAQAKFSIGGWVTLGKHFGGKYDERVLLGPDNTSGEVGKYLQLSVVNLNSTPKVKIGFTATDGSKCEQVFSNLTLAFEQKSHVFVTYDGTIVRGYLNGVEVNSYNLQNCSNKIPAGNSFTVGRGASHATLFVYNLYVREIDEGSGWSRAEPYLQFNGNKDSFFLTTSVANGDTLNVGKEMELRTNSSGDSNSTVFVCEEDRGDKQGECRSDSTTDSDDYHGRVSIDPRTNREFDSGWSSGEGSGQLRYNVQNNFFHGDLDELRIYEKTLSSREIGQLVNGNGLVYQLDEASGRTQFRNAGTDSTQLVCQNAGNCPISGLKGYSGQAIRFTGQANQNLVVEKLRQRFGGSFMVSFWFKPETTQTTPTSLIRSGQGNEGFELLATNNGTTTALNSRFAYSSVDRIGGSGGGEYNLSCSSNEALVGIYGGSGAWMDRVGAICVQIDGAGNWVGSPRQIGTAGGGGGSNYERSCQNGSAIVGFKGRSGALVDQITVECAKLLPDGYVDLFNRTALQAVGGSGGNEQSERLCPSNLPAAGITGRAGGALDSFALTCRNGFAGNSSLTIPNEQWSHLAIAQNGETLLLYVNGQLRQNLWFGPSPRGDYRLTGSYLNDLTLGGKLAGMMDEVQIQPLSSIENRTTTVGNNGGSEYNIKCGANQVLAGLYGQTGNFYGGYWLTRVGAICVAVDQAGNWVGNPQRSGDAGPYGLAFFERTCTRNSAVSSFRAHTSGTINQIVLGCTPLATNGITNPSNPSELEKIGINYGTEQARQSCPNNLAATGIFGGSGAWIDRFGLQCSALLHGATQKGFDESAVVYLALDEVTGSTSFVNTTGKGNLSCASANDCPQSGVKGQVRESLQFNGSTNAPSLTLSEQRQSPFSFSTWVKLPTLPSGTVSLVALHNGAAITPAWRLQLTNSSGKIVPEITSTTSSDGNSCSGSFKATPTDVSLALNQWYHLGVSYDLENGRNDLSLYVNGQLVYQQRLNTLLCRVGNTLRLGQGYKGQMDEFFYYNKPLAISEFLSQYVYQNTWYDVVTTENFKVDYNPPTLKLTANTYLKAGTNIFGVAVNDAESGIKLVEYKDNDGTWKAARSETATSGVWAFGMDIQGSKTIEVRATDYVGNVRTDAKSVSVDSTAPIINLTSSGKLQTLALAGNASDSGSGLQSATIMIIDPLGNAMSSPRDLAVVNGSWHYTQELPAMVNGTFQLWASAVDQIGNRFEGIIGSVQVDNAAPLAGMSNTKVGYGGIAANLPVLKGYVTDQPYPDGMKLFINFEELGNSGSINDAADFSGNQWQAVATGNAPTIVLDGTQHQAAFQLGQTLVISNANSALKSRNLQIDPNSATLSLWINPTSIALAEQIIIQQNGSTGIGLLLKNNQVTLRIRNNGTTIDKDTGQRAVAGQWQLLTVAFNKRRVDEQLVTTSLNLRNGINASTAISVTGGERMLQSAAPLLIGATSNGFAGKIDDIVLYARPLSDLEVRQLSNGSPSAIQTLEVGFLHRQDRNDPSKVVWKNATLATANQGASNWQVQVPAGLEGIYDISLRSSDALGNVRVSGGVWAGVIDTLAPRIALSGTVAGSHQCVMSDFSLSQSKFICADALDATFASEANYAAGSLPAAPLTWDATWYKATFARSVAPARLYVLALGGRDFFGASNSAESCDIYGNCTQCVVSGGNLAAPVCTTYSANTTLQSAQSGNRLPLAMKSAETTNLGGEEEASDSQLVELDLIGPEPFTATIYYERPDAYAPGTEPGSPTSQWVEIVEPYTLIDDAVLASTRPFAASFTAAKTEIDFGESISATQYYVGWTISETAVISDLTAYGGPGVHAQILSDKGRYYAHVVAVDVEGGENIYTLGPIYFDGATPASYLNWDEYRVSQPYQLWQDAVSPTGKSCNLLGMDERVAIYSKGTSPRSATQSFYGTWNEQWLAVAWDGLDVGRHGDLHLYIDSKSGGTIYAFDPYGSIANANSLVVMPERRHFHSGGTDRMLADFAVIIEDGSNIRLMQWNGSSWVNGNASQLKFSYRDGESTIWLPLSLLGANPAAMDVSLVGFATEENSMQVWATMPGNNPLNSPQILPEHASATIAVNNTLVNLQTSMRLSSNPAVNTSLDNCPGNVLFEKSQLEIQFVSDPAGEVYDPVVYDGVRAVVPDDVETLLASLCAGVSDTSNSPVCQLAAQVANNAGGGGPEVGPNGLLPATAGPNDELVFYATVRNLSSQVTGDINLELATNLPSNGTQQAVGSLAPLETVLVSFTEWVDPGAAYDIAEMTIFPIESVIDDEEGLTVDYEHEPHTVIHDIDRSAPFSAELTSELIDNTIGGGVQYLEGVVYDQSPIVEINLETSLGETISCDNSEQIDAFTSDWFCPITIPENTPDGTRVTIKLSATDEYGFVSGVIGEWTIEVDNLSPTVEVTNPPALSAASVHSSSVTETLVLEGTAGDDRLLDGVEVCNTLLGYEACEWAELYFFTSELSTKVQSAANAQLTDQADWVLETAINKGLDNVTVPFTITAWDAFGNGSQQTLQLVIDTLPPTITLHAAPVTQIDFDSDFVLSGRVQDRGIVDFMELEVQTPLGEYEYYTIPLGAENSTNTTWEFDLATDLDAFAMPGKYSYLILAYDALGNMRELGPYNLEVAAPQEPMSNGPYFVRNSNDLWAGFAPGASLYTRVWIDDLDLELGDTISVTTEPIPDWLKLTRLDKQTFEISGTVPLTITQMLMPPPDAITDTAVTTYTTFTINVGVVLEDSTGNQAFQTWEYQVTTGASASIYLPIITNQASSNSQKKIYLPVVSR